MPILALYKKNHIATKTNTVNNIIINATFQISNKNYAKISN